MYKLYARTNTGSAAVEALLAVLAVPHELVDVVKTDDAKAPDWFLKVNPRGEVPALELPDGSVMTESAAIMIHLADSHPDSHMAPAIGSPQRPHYLRWMIYLAATPYATDLRLYYPERYSTNEAHAESIKTKATQDLAKDFAILANAIGQGPYTLGQTMTALDIYAAMLLSWSDDLDTLFAKHKNLEKLYKAVTTNPTIRKVWDRNGMR